MADGGRQINAVKGTTTCTASPAKPCDVASLTVSVTDAEKKTPSFSTSKKLAGDPVDPKTPERVVNALKAAEFYFEVLGSTGVAGTESKQARLTSTATYIGGCGSELHTRPYINGMGLGVNKPVAGPIYLQGPDDSDCTRFTLVATACGRPVNLATGRTGSLRADIAVYAPQDWKVTVSSPMGIKIGFEKEGGLKNTSKTSSRVGGTSKEQETSSRWDGKSSTSTKTTRDGLTTEETLTSQRDSEGEKLTQETKVSSDSGFFTKHELSEEAETPGGSANDRLPVKFKEKQKKFDAGDLDTFKLKIEKDGKALFDTETLKEDIERVMSVLEDFVDVLKGLPKLGYWVEGSVAFLAINGEFTRKRYSHGPSGPRFVTIQNEWAYSVGGKLIEGKLEVGAGLKLKALSSVGGGAELYAYLSGEVTLGIGVNSKKMGYDEPSDMPPDPATTGTLDFEGKLHGKASVVGYGWEYQRTAAVKGKLLLDPQFVGGGFRLRVTRVMGRWRYMVVEKDFWGTPRTYEIEDLWALSTTRLSDDKADALDKAEQDAEKDAPVIDLIVRPSSPYVECISTTRGKARP